MGDNKEAGRYATVMVPIVVAVITLVGVLGAAVLSNWDKLFSQKSPTQAAAGLNTATAPSSASGVRPSRQSVGRSVENKGSLFIIAPPDAEGASIGARILNELQAEGFRIASSRDGAKLLIEIQPPTLEPLQASPIGGLEGFSIGSHSVCC